MRWLAIEIILPVGAIRTAATLLKTISLQPETRVFRHPGRSNVFAHHIAYHVGQIQCIKAITEANRACLRCQALFQNFFCSRYPGSVSPSGDEILTRTSRCIHRLISGNSPTGHSCFLGRRHKVLKIAWSLAPKQTHHRLCNHIRIVVQVKKILCIARRNLERTSRSVNSGITNLRVSCRRENGKGHQPSYSIAKPMLPAAHPPYFLKIFSIALPLANSSISLSK